MANFHPMSAAYLADPYPYLARLRATDPVLYSGDMQGWVVTRYRDCELVLSDPKIFSSDPGEQGSGLGEHVRMARASTALGHAPILANTDPPEHGRLRSPVLGAFAPQQVEPRREPLTTVVNRLLDGIDCRRPAELMTMLAEPLPLVALLDHIGVPMGDRDAFRACVVGIMGARMMGESPEERATGSSAAAERLRILAREAPEGSTILSRLREAVEAGTITEDEMLMLIVHIATAGNAATAFAIGSGLLTLARRPEAWAELRADTSLISGAVAEMLRYDSPTHVTTRFAVADTELAGRRIRKGQAVHTVVASANRDPEAFPDPDTFDIHRKVSRHASFGLGIHFCLGAPLGRLEMEVAITEMLRRFACIEMVPNGYEPGGTLFLRGPKRLFLKLTNG